MHLKTDDGSIKSSLRLQHVRQFCEAVQAVQEAAKIQSVRDFRVKFNSLRLPDEEEKDWMLNATATITNTSKKGIAESLEWAVSLRTALNDATHDRVRFVIAQLGGGAVEWIQAFGRDANMQRLQEISTTLGRNNIKWIESVPAERRTCDLVFTCLTGLKTATFTRDEIRKLWDEFKDVDADAVWTLAEEVPEPLHKAYLHRPKLGGADTFWMTAINQTGDQRKQLILRMAPIVYEGATWSEQPKKVNLAACGLAFAMDRPWAKLFTIGELVTITDTFEHLPGLKKNFFLTAGVLAETHTETEGLGEWLSLYCHLVAELAHNGYSVTAIWAMFENKLTKREIITCTWFRREKCAFTADDDLLFKVLNTNGGVIGRRSHLAMRHLYVNFDFSEIKDKNSFHPRGTTSKDIANLAANMTLSNRDPGAHSLGLYVVVVGEPTGRDKANVEKRLIISFYPRLPGEAHGDYYTGDQLKAIEKVLKWVPLGSPELAWR